MSGAPHEALLLIGSNVEPERHVPAALALLEGRFDVVAVSARYRSAAVGGTGSYPDFVNLAVRIRTDCPPRALREACRRLEEVCDRRRTADRYAPRTLDIDVVLFGDQVVDPDLEAQAHCLVPCADAWPDARHPVRGETLEALKDALSAEERDALHRLDPSPGAGR